MKVIILAAGRGTRLSSSPDAPPKAMFQLCGRPLLEHVLAQTGQFIAPEDTTIVVGYKKECIMDYFGSKYHYVEQSEQLGTGHAVMQCAESFRDYDGAVLIAFGDMILFRGKVMEAQCRHHEETHAACTLMTAVNPELTLWARILRDSQGRFVRVVEGKDCTPEQAKIPELEAGVLVFDSKKLFRMLPSLRDNNIQHEYYLTDIPEMMAAQGMLVETYATDDPEDVFGVNSPEDVSRCERIVLAREAHGESRAK